MQRMYYITKLYKLKNRTGEEGTFYADYKYTVENVCTYLSDNVRSHLTSSH